MRSIRLFLLLLLLPAGPIAAQPTTSNLDRERSWADQVADTIVVGEAVWLSNRGHRFLTIYTAPEKPGATAVILLHGRGVHPAWGFINRLRADLAEAGYHTLSLQLPILAPDAPFGTYGQTFPEAFERVGVAIRYLQGAKKVRRVVLLGHSSGAVTALGYAVRFPGQPVAAVVAIGTPTYPNTTDIQQPILQLRQIRVPVADVYGSHDLQEVLSHATARLEAARAGRADYTVLRISGADHFYTDHYERMRTQVIRWLARFRRP